MIFILRKIRKNMIENKKARSYILYAIGEILLVVIGIILAVQINNWNEEKNLQKSAEAHLAIFHQNLLVDLEVLQTLEVEVDKQFGRSEMALRQFKTLEPLNDSLAPRITNLIIEYNFDAEKNGFSLLNNSGEITSFPDDLQNLIASYYTLVERIKDREEISNSFIKDKYEADIMSTRAFLFNKNNVHASFYEDDPRPTKPIDYETLIKDKGLEILIYARRHQTKTQHQSYVDALEVLEELIEMVEH
jgi:uncharacterized protein DUF6090